MSDVAGQDIESHGNDPEKAINAVRSWPRINSQRNDIPGGKEMWERYPRFQHDLPSLLQNARISPSELDGPTYYMDYVNFVVEWLRAVQAQTDPT